MADTTITTRPTNGVSYGHRHTVVAGDVDNVGLLFDFQSTKPLAAIVEYMDNSGTVISLANSAISFPANGQVRFFDPTKEEILAATIELRSTYTAHIEDVAEHTVEDTANALDSSLDSPTTMSEAYAALADLMAKYNSHDDDVDGDISTLANGIFLANKLQTALVDHMADTGEHLLADPAGTTLDAITEASDLASLITLTTGLITAYVAHDDDVDEVTPTYHQATSTLNNLASAVAPTDLAECVARLDDIADKFTLHDADSTSHTTGGTYAISDTAFHQATTTEDQIVDITAPTTPAEAITDIGTIITALTNHDADSTSHTTGGTHAPSSSPITSTPFNLTAGYVVSVNAQRARTA